MVTGLLHFRGNILEKTELRGLGSSLYTIEFNIVLVNGELIIRMGLLVAFDSSLKWKPLPRYRRSLNDVSMNNTSMNDTYMKNSPMNATSMTDTSINDTPMSNSFMTDTFMNDTSVR